MNAYPLLIEFVPGTRVYREPEVVPKLPIVQNGPPGTSIVFADGTKVPLQPIRLSSPRMAVASPVWVSAG